jgi:hypothetical protein
MEVISDAAMIRQISVHTLPFQFQHIERTCLAWPSQPTRQLPVSASAVLQPVAVAVCGLVQPMARTPPKESRRISSLALAFPARNSS